ncbi:MAG: permease-like cell division protein FtsX [Thiobacillus sp.]
MIGWLRHQKHALAEAVRRLAAQPLSTLLAALAMGVAISLPSGLYLLIGNLERLAGTLPAQPEISVFLADDASAAQKEAVAARLRGPDIAHARFIPKDEALVALSAAQELGDVTAGLTENPLPDAWLVRPRVSTRAELGRLAADLNDLPGVAETHVDSAWAERLQTALELGRTGVWVLAGLFAVALAAISGNVIRAQVLARRDEIQVSRLIGATDRYVRRPFLYVGALQGGLGGVATLGILAFSGEVLRPGVERLAGLYGSSFQLVGPGVAEITVVLAATALFGWLGAWLAVTRTLHRVEGEP